MKLDRVQVLRRTVQVLVLLLTVAMPVVARYANYLSARQLDRVTERMQGSAQGAALQATDRVLRTLAGVEGEGEGVRPDERDELLLAARRVRGSTWSLELFGVTLTDPLAFAESALASRSLPRVLLLGVLLPLLGTLLLGRVFCSWICPVGFLLELGGKLRRVLRFLELEPGRLRLWPGNKHLILLVGLALCFVVGLPVLGYLYPPALLARETHNGVAMMFDRGEEGLLGFSAAGLTIASWILLGIALVELGLGPRLWCRSLCPGGALYALLGRHRLVRVRRDPVACTQCGQCVVACEMALSPMTDSFGMDCDNCGKCVQACDDEALGWCLSPRDRGDRARPAGDRERAPEVAP